MALISQPSTGPVDRQDDQGIVVELNGGWRNFFQAVYNICFALTQSGTTAQRPVTLLWAGRFYWDTTLTRPIWWTGANWVRADGVIV